MIWYLLFSLPNNFNPLITSISETLSNIISVSSFKIVSPDNKDNFKIILSVDFSLLNISNNS